jgi:protein-disulfide isomerase
MNATARNAFIIVLAVIAAVGIALIVNSQRSSTPASTGGADSRTVTYTVNNETQSVTLTKLTEDPFVGARFVQGADSAPVTVVEFADYQCPACAQFANFVASQFKTEFVDTGKVRYAYRDFPLDIHPNAPLAAVAASCANAERRWAAMHDFLFRAQGQWAASSTETFKTQLVDYARQLGLDNAAFQTCLSSNQFEDAIQRDRDAGTRAGLNGTPTFVVNGYRLDSDRVPSIETLRAVMAEFGAR